MGNSLPWKETYSVRVDEIDNQHMKLFHLVDKLNDAIKFQSSEIIIRKVLIELMDYAKYHFNTEEKYFDSYNYPLGTLHKIEHDEFVKEVLEISEKFRNGDLEVPKNLINFIQNWIIKHVLGTDMLYKGVFKNRKEFKTLNDK